MTKRTKRTVSKHWPTLQHRHSCLCLLSQVCRFEKQQLLTNSMADHTRYRLHHHLNHCWNPKHNNTNILFIDRKKISILTADILNKRWSYWTPVSPADCTPNAICSLTSRSFGRLLQNNNHQIFSREFLFDFYRLSPPARCNAAARCRSFCLSCRIWSRSALSSSPLPKSSKINNHSIWINDQGTH